MSRKIAAFLSALAAAATVTACGHHVKSVASDSEVATLSPDERAGIDEARTEVTQATQEQTKVSADIEVQKREQDVAGQEVKRANAEFAIAETNLKSANEGKNADEILAAKQRRDHAKGEVDYRKSEAKHQDAEMDLRRARLAEAQAWETFARAKVELEKAKAITKKAGDASPDAQKKLAIAEQQSADKNLKHANARATTAKAQKRAEKMKAEADTLKAAIPAGA